MSPGLCHRILDHLEQLGWLQPGMRILDFMAGTGLTGLVAASRGYPSTLVELEEKFVGLAQANKERLEKKLGHPIDMEILQGDARQLSSLLGGQDVGVVSPPWNLQSGGKGEASRQATPDSGLIDRHGGGIKGGTGDSLGNIGNLRDEPIGIVSPPYFSTQQAVIQAVRKEYQGQKRLKAGAHHGTSGGFSAHEIVGGDAEGQIGKLPDVGIVSPPYTEARPQSSWEPQEAWRPEFKGRGKAFHSSTPGQIAELPDVAIVSPPYEDSRLDPLQPTYSNPVTPLYQGFQPSGYGTADGQIGQEKTESYLQAMKTCYAEAFKVCPVLVIVVKDPTRDGKIRELGKDTVSLLEQVGYQIHCIHKAILFEEQEQGHLFEGSQKKVKGRMSFFKRLAYRKGSPVARWEWIVFARRLGNGPVALVSPPYGEVMARETHSSGVGGLDSEVVPTYGSTPGQIGRLK